MGLSDEERQSGIFYAIRELVKVRHDWDEDHRLQSFHKEEFSHVRKLLTKLWHTFLGSQSNGLHWIMGSSSSDVLEGDPSTPWEMGIVHFGEQVWSRLQKKEGEDENAFNWDSDSELEYFNALGHCDIPFLLTHDHYQGVSASYVFRVYQWTEQLIYYLRRYPDEFQDRLSGLSELASEILGECFSAFTGEEIFAKAYFICQIVEMLYGPGYPYNKENRDVVVQILSDGNVHHDFARLMKWSIDDIAVHHVELVKARLKGMRKAEDRYKYSDDLELLRVRLYKTIEFHRSAHQYEHVRKDVFALLEKAKVPKKWVTEIKKRLEVLAVEFVADKEDSDDSYRNEKDQMALAAYGHDAYMDLDNWMEKEGVHPNQKKWDELHKKQVVKKPPVKKPPAKKLVKRVVKKRK